MKIICQNKDRTQGCSYLSNFKICNLKESGFHNCPEFLNKFGLWSQSSLKNFCRCDRLYELHNLKGWQSKKKNATAELGKLFGQQIQKLYQKVEPEPIKLTDDEINFEDYGKAKVSAIIQAIQDNVFLINTNFNEKNQSEVYFQFQRGHQFYHGYLDLLMDRFDSFLTYKLIEFKYTTKPENYTRFNNQFQNILYMLSQDVNEIMLQLWVKPALILKKNESYDEFKNRNYQIIKGNPGKYLQEKIFYLSEYNLTEFDRKINSLHEQLKLNLHSGYFSQKYNCFDPFKCDFWEICNDNANIENSLNYERR